MSKAKKKGKKGKKGKKKDGGDGLELSLEEKFKKTTQEVDILKEQLARRQQDAQRSKSGELSARQKLEAAKTTLTEEKTLTKDLTYDLTRQYKTQQLHYERRLQELEITVLKLNDKLEFTENQLSQVTKERDQIKKEKDTEVAALNSQIKFIQKSYETIIKDALDGLAEQMEKSRVKWDGEGQVIDGMTQTLLQNFGNPIVYK